MANVRHRRRRRPVRVLVTGGAGFVGCALARAFAAQRGAVVVALDNLRRRGSETNLMPLADAGVRFVHGDVRNRGDLHELEGVFDVVVDAAAEASVLAGVGGSPAYVLETNLVGTMNLLELARQRAGALLFLSSSRVYSIEPLRALPLRETDTRFELVDPQPEPGASAAGIAEGFPTGSPRSFYGASKLASEMLVQEYEAAYGLRAVVTRCGTIAGAGQFGRSEQGVVAMWAANHVLGQPLSYIGFGGEGKQVRDLLHPDDLHDLLGRQLEAIERCSGSVFNAGGGREGSVSLRELTGLCREAAAREVPVGSDPHTSSVDVPLYLTNNGRVTAELGWEPSWTPARIVEEIVGWVRANEDRLRPVLT
jgi:CDP-paratose 2-epimerase